MIIHFELPKDLYFPSLSSSSFVQKHLGTYTVEDINKIKSGVLYFGHCDGGYNEVVGKIGSLLLVSEDLSDVFCGYSTSSIARIDFTNSEILIYIGEKIKIAYYLTMADINPEDNDLYDNETEEWITWKEWESKFSSKLK